MIVNSVLPESGILFCELTITGIARFLAVLHIFPGACIFDSGVLISNILGLLRVHLFFEIYMFQMLPWHAPFLLHNVARWKQARAQFEQWSRKYPVKYFIAWYSNSQIECVLVWSVLLSTTSTRHSGQNVVDSRGLALWVQNKFWPLDDAWTTISTSKDNVFFFFWSASWKRNWYCPNWQEIIFRDGFYRSLSQIPWLLEMY